MANGTRATGDGYARQKTRTEKEIVIKKVEVEKLASDVTVAEDGRRREEGKRVVRLQVAEEIVIYSAKVSKLAKYIMQVVMSWRRRACECRTK
jgi:hypothetical protein